MKNNKIIKFLIVVALILATSLVFIGCAPKPNYKLITPDSITVQAGNREKIEATVKNYKGTPTFTYESDNETVAIVEDDYVVGVAQGIATITVRTKVDGKNLVETISVTVNPIPRATATYMVDGKLYESQEYNVGSTIDLPTPPTKASTAQYNYRFDGWEGYQDGAVINGDVTFIAKWTPLLREYTVTFKNGDDVYQTSKQNYGDTVVIPSDNPTKQGDAQYSYEFAGWRGYLATDTVVGDVIYEADYNVSIKSYSVKFMVEGTLLKEETLLYGSPINLPTSLPTKQGDAQYSYEFEGWSGYSAGMTVDGNKEFNATFTPKLNTYRILFKVNGIIVKEDILSYDSPIVPPQNPTKEPTAEIEYVFVGWKNFEQGAKVEGDAEFNAEFTESARKYTISVYEGDVEVYSTKAEYCTRISDALTDFALTAPEGYEYSFEYEGELVTSDVSVFATKVAKVYTVKFINGTTELKSERLAYGTKITAPENPTKNPSTTTVYSFSSWATVDGDDSTVVDFSQDMTVKSDVVYYAQYSTSVRKYNVVFSVDGKVYESYQKEYGEQVVLPQNEPTKEQTTSTTYLFLYWKNYNDGDHVFEDVEYEAVFSETLTKYTVTYIVEGAQIASEEVEYGKVVTMLDEPEKEESEGSLYTFSHWETDGKKFDLNSPIVADIELVAVFAKAFRTSGKVVLPTSYFNENYSLYTNVSVIIDGNEYATQNGEFTAVLSEGEYTLTTDCAGFKSVSKKLSVSKDTTDWGEIQVVEHDLTLSGMASNENGVISPGVNDLSANNRALVKEKTLSDIFALRYTVNPTSLAYNGSKNKDMFIGFRVGSLDVMINRNNKVRFLIDSNYDYVNDKTYTGEGLQTFTLPYALTLIVDRTSGFNLSFFVNDTKVFDDDLSSYEWGTLSLPTGELSVGVFYNTSPNNYTKAPVTLSEFDYCFTPSVVSGWVNAELITVSGSVAFPQTNIFGESNLDYYDYKDVTVIVNGTTATVNEDLTFSAKAKPGTVTVVASANDFALVSKKYASSSDLEIAEPIELIYNDWSYTTRQGRYSTTDIKSDNGVINWIASGTTNYQVARYAKATDSSKIMISQRVNPTEYWKSGKDTQQASFYIEDASAPTNNLTIIWLGHKLRFLINMDWNNSYIDKTFTHNTSVDTRKATQPFTLTSIIERNATEQTFILKVYVDDLKVYEGDVASFTGVGTSAGTNKADYKTQVPYSNAYFGVGANWSNSENYQGVPLRTDNVGYSFNATTISSFENSSKIS